ncbi:hypothetical protein HHA03_02090 [Halolactibacillus halophilus]|uniref:Uncharacterized protein n=1 Tax=Halolactibacillus halophilus TaxID=306540 RepID=A0ABQ0VHM3_9BACI|nr:hypothetical protein HHA03_02090 [Halolactibacillus halophilus]
MNDYCYKYEKKAIIYNDARENTSIVDKSLRKKGEATRLR